MAETTFPPLKREPLLGTGAVGIGITGDGIGRGGVAGRRIGRRDRLRLDRRRPADNPYPLAAREYLDEAEGLLKQFEAEKGYTPDDWSGVRDAFPTSFRQRGKPSLHVV
jgi:hypothetical protein